MEEVCQAGGSELPASHMQKGLWFLQQLNPKSAFYNIPSVWRIAGPLDSAALRASLEAIVERHSALRTRFVSLGGKPVQIVEQHLPPEFEVSTGHGDTNHLLREFVTRPFDLTRGPLVRSLLVSHTPERWTWAFVVHHLVFDGWSAAVLLDELSELYASAADGTLPQLLQQPAQFYDFVESQAERKWLAEVEGQLGYWRDKLGDADRVLDLPFDSPRPATQEFVGATEHFAIPHEMAQGMRCLAMAAGVTPFMVALSAFVVLMCRYAHTDDVNIGVPIAIRQPQYQSTIGPLLNTVVMRLRTPGDHSFLELLSECRETVMEAFANQDAPFELVVDALRVRTDLSHNPLYQVTFQMYESGWECPAMPGLVFEAVHVDPGTTQFDLSFDLVNSGDQIAARIQYDTHLFEPSSIVAMASRYVCLLRNAIEDPNHRVDDLRLTPEQIEAKALRESMAVAPRPPAFSLVEPLSRVCERYSTRTAVRDGDLRLTYKDLEVRCNRLASYLRLAGIESGTRVAVCLPRSALLLVTMLGVMKSGGALVPLDAQSPAARLRSIVEEAQCDLLVTAPELEAQVGKLNVPVLVLTLSAIDCLEGGLSDFLEPPSPETLAYVMFTSGSTGKPKGVEVEHGALCSFAMGTREAYALDKDDVVLQFSSPAFDVIFEETMPTWLAGGTVLVNEGAVRGGGRELAEAVRSQGITVLNLPASFWHEWIGILESERLNRPIRSLRRMIVGSEPVSSDCLSRWFSLHDGPGILTNAYGTVETTLAFTRDFVRGEPTPRQPTLPIGKPLRHVRAYIVDDQFRLVPDGLIGELCVGGSGLARGYVGRPELSAAQFCADPFARDGSTIYRTGDHARRLPNGDIELRGRADSQTKVRGFRVEMEEIESAICRHHEVDAALVSVGGDGALAAYVVTQSLSLQSQSLRDHLLRLLPDYMLPAAFYRVGELPLTLSGKIDRACVPPVRSDLASTGPGTIGPTSELEDTVEQVWSEVLGRESLDLEATFFEQGGDSLLLLRLHSRLRRELGVDLRLADLLQHPSIRSLAQFLAARMDDPPTSADDPAQARRAAST